MNTSTPHDPWPADFDAVAAAVYAQDPQWLPEGSVAADFAPVRAYAQAEAVRLWWLPGRARLAGFFSAEPQIRGEKAAFFGYWEGQDDVAAHAALFGAFEAWARQQGAQRVYGPLNFTTYGRYRLRLDEAGSPFPDEPYNPAYYPRLLQGLGYTLAEAYLSQDIPVTEFDHIYRVKDLLIRQLDRSPFRIEYLSREYWLSRLPDFYEVADQIFRDNFAYRPVPYETFAAAYGPQGAARRFCPLLSIVALDAEDRIAGFALNYPDYGPLLRQGAGTGLRLADIDYARDFPRLEAPRLLMKTVGVHPDYRGQQLMSLMIARGMLRFREHYARVMACLMRQDNPSLKAFGAFKVETRRYGLYSRAL